MKIALQLWAILTLAVALLGRDKPKDVDGWATDKKALDTVISQ